MAPLPHMLVSLVSTKRSPAARRGTSCIYQIISLIIFSATCVAVMVVVSTCSLFPAQFLRHLFHPREPFLYYHTTPIRVNISGSGMLTHNFLCGRAFSNPVWTNYNNYPFHSHHSILPYITRHSTIASDFQKYILHDPHNPHDYE